MLSRRILNGSALLAPLVGFTYSIGGAAAQQAPASPGPGAVARNLLRRNDLAGTTHETVQMMVEFGAGAEAPWHTHPGHEGAILLEGEVTLTLRGEAPLVFKAGDSFLVPAGLVHMAKNGSRLSKLFITYTVEKGKPLASPA